MNQVCLKCLFGIRFGITPTNHLLPQIYVLTLSAMFSLRVSVYNRDFPDYGLSVDTLFVGVMSGLH